MLATKFVLGHVELVSLASLLIMSRAEIVVGGCTRTEVSSLDVLLASAYGSSSPINLHPGRRTRRLSLSEIIFNFG